VDPIYVEFAVAEADYLRLSSRIRLDAEGRGKDTERRLELFLADDSLFPQKGRFVVSYALWEEKFSVTRITDGRKKISHLDARAAETWCLDQMPLDPPPIGESEQFFVNLEVRAQQPRSAAPFGWTRWNLRPLWKSRLMISHRDRTAHRRNGP
jgi:hypothetical protein